MLWLIWVRTVSASFEENISGAPNGVSACRCTHGSAIVSRFLLHRSSGTPATSSNLLVVSLIFLFFILSLMECFWNSARGIIDCCEYLQETSLGRSRLCDGTCSAAYKLASVSRFKGYVVIYVVCYSKCSTWSINNQIGLLNRIVLSNQNKIFK